MGRMSNRRWLPDTSTPNIFQASLKSFWLTGYRSFALLNTVFCTGFVTNCLQFISITGKSLYFHNNIFNFNSKLLSSFMQIECWWSRIMALLYVFLQPTGTASRIKITEYSGTIFCCTKHKLYRELVKLISTK